MHHRAKGQTTGLQTKELRDKLWDNGTAGLWDKLQDCSYNRTRSGPIVNRTDNRFTGQQDHGINHGTTELWDKLWDCRTMGQWDYRTNYGTALITGSTVSCCQQDKLWVHRTTGQQDKPQDYRATGQQNYGINYRTAHIMGSEAVLLPKKPSLCIIDNSQCVYCVTPH